MKKIISRGVALALLTGTTASAQVMMAPPPGAMVAPPPVMVPQQYCRPYVDRFKIDREERVSRGLACLQPDGSWQLQPSQSALRYVQRGGGLFIVPSAPFAVVIDDHHRHHDHDHDRDHWDH